MRWGRMKAIVQDRYGSADVLDFRDVARPEFGPEDMLVKVVGACASTRAPCHAD